MTPRLSRRELLRGWGGALALAGMQVPSRLAAARGIPTDPGLDEIVKRTGPGC